MNKLKHKNYKIKGLYKINPKIFKDNRGYFFESFNKKKYNFISTKDSFVQDNHSFSYKNVLRGIHFQHKNPQSQLFYLVKGRIFLTIVDFRPNSKTFLNKLSFELNAKNHEQIYMAPGLGSGFYSLSKDIHLIYKVSKLYSSKNEIGIRWDDPKLNINWPCKNPIISKKDLNNFFVRDINFNKLHDLSNL